VQLVQELVPITFGLLLGGALGLVRPSIRLPLGAGLAVVLGVLASAATGELQTSWGYVLIDVPLVAVSALLGLVTGRRGRPLLTRG
jgi:hypothetical protein